MKRISLIDCPGVVPATSNDTDTDLLLRGVVRVENVTNPAQYVYAALGMCERRHVERTYNIRGWENAEEFLDQLAGRSGRLLKGGEKDLDGAAKMFLNDFLRGRVPWFVKPPRWGETRSEEPTERVETKGDVTKLNQQAASHARKRKHDEMEDGVKTSQNDDGPEEPQPIDECLEDEDVEGFESFSSDEDESVLDPDRHRNEGSTALSEDEPGGASLL